MGANKNECLGSHRTKKGKVSDSASHNKENINIDVTCPKPKLHPIKKSKDNNSEGSNLPLSVENDAVNALLNLKGVRQHAPMDQVFDDVMGFQASDYEDLDQEDAEKENGSEVDELESSESSAETGKSTLCPVHGSYLQSERNHLPHNLSSFPGGIVQTYGCVALFTLQYWLHPFICTKISQACSNGGAQSLTDFT
ncbi:uncharacterized protein LACBIDRAFT_328143 [Laccaria bicolor S238N-H82]|uniref:Predicted protein n=1 Tax=Laccaria bicolor (strain S238N-H82 / ATCC MYA-4686) TaxID=486041 RepID=B0DDW0_LACBS|nr:uncharacterized protein LACBIDRAFT_328143 [Laccaria bicolor S238N-H82]EDR07286.1 predicted protein [Laccaria bicolor S238N-H82]|eukprot:XP_001882217.1 predicted protein [Laccaria bicolor S238N-H82]